MAGLLCVLSNFSAGPRLIASPREVMPLRERVSPLEEKYIRKVYFWIAVLGGGFAGVLFGRLAEATDDDYLLASHISWPCCKCGAALVSAPAALGATHPRRSLVGATDAFASLFLLPYPRPPPAPGYIPSTCLDTFAYLSLIHI